MTAPESILTATTKQEEWRAIEGWEGLYEVSDLGRVRSLRKAIRHPGGAVLRPHLNSDNYPRVDLYRNYARERHFVHLLVARAFVGPCLPGMEVNHKDRNRLNSCADNLEYLTHLENVHHAYDSGCYVVRGESRASKLTERDVRDIRASSESMAVLAARYNISRTHASHVRCGAAWRHVLP